MSEDRKQARAKELVEKKLKSWTVCLAVYAEKYVTVEAATEDEAKQIAEESEENSFPLCSQCSDNFEMANVAGEAVCVEEVNENEEGTE